MRKPFLVLLATAVGLALAGACASSDQLPHGDQGSDLATGTPASAGTTGAAGMTPDDAGPAASDGGGASLRAGAGGTSAGGGAAGTTDSGGSGGTTQAGGAAGTSVVGGAGGTSGAGGGGGAAGNTVDGGTGGSVAPPPPDWCDGGSQAPDCVYQGKSDSEYYAACLPNGPWCGDGQGYLVYIGQTSNPPDPCYTTQLSQVANPTCCRYFATVPNQDPSHNDACQLAYPDLHTPNAWYCPNGDPTKASDVACRVLPHGDVMGFPNTWCCP